MGIAAYSEIARIMGKDDVAEKYLAKASEMAKKWEEMARDGDHYRLAFDRPDTWSQKYNMVWDKMWNTNIFPKEVMQKEIAYYLTKQEKYGLPLDCRKKYTKSDWIMWTAAMADDQKTLRGRNADPRAHQRLVQHRRRYVAELPRTFRNRRTLDEGTYGPRAGRKQRQQIKQHSRVSANKPYGQ